MITYSMTPEITEIDRRRAAYRTAYQDYLQAIKNLDSALEEGKFDVRQCSQASQKELDLHRRYRDRAIQLYTALMGQK
jgi:uncharacterized protein involved in exopolysaccharide biosynthesis